MTVSTAALANVAIGTTLAASNQLEFEADNYTVVGEAEDLGEFGDTAEEVGFTSLNDRRMRKFKGAFNAGNMTIQLGLDVSDAGQTALLAAFASDDDYNFRVELNDGSNSNTFLYFRGKVMTSPFNVGNVNNVVRRTFTVGINSAIVQVDAT